MLNKFKNKIPELERSYMPNVFDTLKLLKQKPRVKAGSYLYRESDYCKSFIWLVEGSFRVFKSSSRGREVTLYRVFPGDLCVLNLRCMLTNEKYFANAIAETELIVFTLSKEGFYRLVDESNEFQRYLLKCMSQSLYDIAPCVRIVVASNYKLEVRKNESKIYSII